MSIRKRRIKKLLRTLLIMGILAGSLNFWACTPAKVIVSPVLNPGPEVRIIKITDEGVLVSKEFVSWVYDLKRAYAECLGGKK